MRRYNVQLKSISPYSQGRHYDVPKLDKEGHDAYEKRTWRERMHVSERGTVIIPPMAIKNCLSEAAKYLSIQIPGKGKSTYTKHVEAGTMVIDPIDTGVVAADVIGESLFVPADGVRGSGKRVVKCFPRIDAWSGSTDIYVMDETVTEDVLLRILTEAGSLIGIGRFRPRNNGYYGRFKVLSMTEVSDV